MPRNLNDSTAVTVLFMMVSGGEQRGENRELFSTGRRAVRREHNPEELQC